MVGQADDKLRHYNVARADDNHRHYIESMRAAVISIGTNSCRLLIASLGAGGRFTPEYHESRGTRLGEGIAPGKLLEPEAAERTLAAVSDYATLARHANRTFAIGTSALREAADAGAFAARVHELTGANLHVLIGDEEAHASFDGAKHGLSEAGVVIDGVLTVADVGGGSAEIARRDGEGQLVRTASLPLGAVRLTERFLVSDPPTADELERCRAAIALSLDALDDAAQPRGMLACVGGTAATAVRMLQAEEDRGVARVSAAALADLGRAVAALPVAQRKRMHGLSAQRADIIAAGLLVLESIAAAAGAPEFLIVQADLLTGYLLEHADS
jgi:exopolyphosphatase/guanosine-5'-triphosphate,3'-diphosphate pyrophosphatase